MEKQNLNSNNDTYLAQWLAGELSDDTLQTLVSESDFKAYIKLRKGIDVYTSLNAETDSSFTEIQKKIGQRKQSKVRPLNTKRWWMGIAASVVILFGVFSLLRDTIVSVETGFGEKQTIVLLDGSEVILNSKSTITYNEDTWKDNRTLSLSGEAYFKVAKGSTFTVETNNGEVKVLGTQFNVNSTQDLFEVVCYEGKVGVSSHNEAIVLLPTHTVRRINGDAIETWQVAETKPYWTRGESAFKSVPLKYVITALESEYDVTFNVDNVDTNMIFTGSFPHDNINTALQTVFKTLDITYFEKEKGLIYLSVK